MQALWGKRRPVLRGETQRRDYRATVEGEDDRNEVLSTHREPINIHINVHVMGIPFCLS